MNEWLRAGDVSQAVDEYLAEGLPVWGHDWLSAERKIEQLVTGILRADTGRATHRIDWDETMIELIETVDDSLHWYVDVLDRFLSTLMGILKPDPGRRARIT